MYVPLSRVRSLNDLAIMRPFNEKILHEGQNPDLTAEMTRFLTLEKATLRKYSHILVEFYSFLVF